MVDSAERFAAVEKMIDMGDYFTINRARQYGKTTTHHLILITDRRSRSAPCKNNKLMKQFFIIFATILALSSCNRYKGEHQWWSDSIPVETLVVGDGRMPTERNYIGSIASEQEIALSFPLGGTLTKVAVGNGDRVSKGQLLAEVDATTAASLHATALATLRQAEDAYRRLEPVYREGGLSEVKWVEMETNLEKARQSEVSARKHLEDCTIRAPFNGVVSCEDRQVGQEMRPGETFCKVVDMKRLRVEFSVPEQEISLIEKGDVATAKVPSLGEGTLTLIINDKSLNANPLGHTYKIFASIEKAEGGLKVEQILPDMVAKVHIRLTELGGIVVPSDCVETMPEGTVVWVLEGGKTFQRQVKVGDFIRNGVMIESGLKSGDTVVTSGHQKLFSGARVLVISD